MTHVIAKKYIKMGELKAILKNVDDNGRIKNNCIALAKNDCVLLRTNGVVIYGLYDTTKQGNFGHRNPNLIQFTHDMVKENPYVNTQDYVTYKPIVLKAYKEIFTETVKQKYEAVRFIILNHKWYKDQLSKAQTSTDAEQEPKVPVDQNIIEEKKEVVEMNKELNVMGLAHKIRRELGLEGDYRAQMKMAMLYAWSIKKGVKTLEEVLGEESTEAAAPTYNVANTTVEEEVVVDVDKPSNNTDDVQYEFRLFEASKGVYKLGITDLATGKVKYYANTINSLNMAAAYLYVGKRIESIVKTLPNNTRLIAMPITITACKTRPGLKDVCLSKNLSYETFKVQKIMDQIKVAPSGKAI